ncbi:multiple sugar transport system permease protein/putative aldouronate transport system permease protein [Paenibacillus catalpae]|uniref:Multiple sugar transport system permease protein/putative aldouronate transport system permease protein n=1 Tax=Paenibacillus catalpae TaxID=1045775 RepID=A0A1I1SW66_9BACL|nr:carbohydrate ABC transporter permease [Paenibacillus catalpae]SFD48988.1 multiple sugar transport system permease protein/putative aldouronate transport system permease protein [Paenibacillus catalpae]
MVRTRSFGSISADVCIYFLLGLVTLSTLYPLWYTVAVSFSDSSAVAGGFVTWWPVDFNLAAYHEIVSDHKFYKAFLVSIERVLLGTTISFVITLLMAYPLSKENSLFPGRNIIMWFLVVIMLFNSGLIPWYMTIKSYGMLDSIWALVLPYAVPVFNIILVINYFRGLPKELEEAGLVDGAGPWYLLLNIYLPLSVPVMATVTLFSIVFHWNAFFDGLILMNRPEHYPLQSYVQQLVVNINTTDISSEGLKSLSLLSNKTLNAAKIVVTMLPVLVIYPFLQRYFVHGITLGAVKE